MCLFDQMLWMTLCVIYFALCRTFGLQEWLRLLFLELWLVFAPIIIIFSFNISFLASHCFFSSVTPLRSLGRPHLQLHNWPTVPQPKIWRQVLRNWSNSRHFLCRFFYENGGWPSSFTLDQLEQIRRFSLARLLCDNTDQIETIQVRPNLNRVL